MSPVQYHSVTFVDDIIDQLCELGIVNENTRSVLQIAHQHGGFIAGGFAATFAKAYTLNPKIPGWADHGRYVLLEYMGNSGYSLDNYVTKRDWWKRTHGDIDVWFHSARDFQEFSDSVNFKNRDTGVIISQPTPGGWGVEYSCFDVKGKNGQMVQAISRLSGAPETVLDSFDIYNAMCWFHGKELHVPDGWEWLCTNKLVHLNHWRREVAVQRLAKYVKKHGYSNGLTPGSLKHLNDNFLEILDMTRSGKIVDFGMPIEESKFVWDYVHPLLSQLTPENLMRVSLDYGANEYRSLGEDYEERKAVSPGKNPALRELFRRSEATLQRPA